MWYWSVTENYTEDDHQKHIVKELRRGGYLFRAGMEGVRLSVGVRSKMKALGMEPGLPDLEIYLNNRLVMIELKRWRGVVSDAQKAVHKRLREYGYEVHVIKEKTPEDSWGKVCSILNG